MTVERKIVVGLDDLRALTFECKECRAGLRYPPPENRVTLSNHANLVDAIGKIRAQEKGSDEWPKFRVLLEFDEPELAGRKES